MKLSDSIPLWLRAPRNSLWLAAAVVLMTFIAVISPVQLPVVLYKAALVSLAVVMGYWLDRALFPYARPDGFLERDWRLGTDEPLFAVDYRVVKGYEMVYALAMIRRAVLVGVVIVGIALGL